MPITIWLAAFAVAAAAPLAWWSVAGSRATHARVRANLQTGNHTDLRKALLETSAQDRVMRPAVESLVRRARRLTPAGMIDALDKRIGLAGMSNEWTVDRLLAI